MYAGRPSLFDCANGIWNQVSQCFVKVGLLLTELDAGASGVIPEQENLRSGSCPDLVMQKYSAKATFTSYLKTFDIRRAAIQEHRARTGNLLA